MEGRKGKIQFHTLGRLFNHKWHANMDGFVKELYTFCNRWRDTGTPSSRKIKIAELSSYDTLTS